MAFRLTPKEDSFYELFGVSAGHLVEAAKELTNLLAVDTPEDRKAVASGCTTSSTLGDEATHEIMRKVNSSFITPFDREDIYALASHPRRLHGPHGGGRRPVVLYRIADLPGGRRPTRSRSSSRMSELTAEAMPRLRSMKDLSEYWIEINRLENQADQIYRRLLASLFNGEYAPTRSPS